MKKFGKNDVFYNTLSANPSYKVVFYNGNVTVNDQLSEGNKVSSSITMLERNTIYTASLSENFTKNNFFYSASFSISGTFSYTPQVQRNFIAYKSGGAFYEHYTLYNTVKKLYALNNVFTKYSLDNNNANTAKYLNTSLVQAGSLKNIYPSGYPDYFLKPLMDINFIEIPSAYYGIKLQPGMVNLKIYVTGTLVAEASDTQKNTKIYQTYSSYNSSLVGTEIGTVLYDEGIIILTGSSKLADTNEFYVQPVSDPKYSVDYTYTAISDDLRWIYFGAHQKTTTNAGSSTPIVSASYELNFQGSTERSTITMFCSAEKNDLTWSNNRTFISGGQLNSLVLGQTSSIVVNGTTYNAPTGSYFVPSNGQYFENDQLVIKNTISSSFVNYNSPYKSQVFISEIGVYNEEGDLIAIAKLANPVRKTPELDYTIKLKLDI